jgi:hypothetical protein
LILLRASSDVGLMFIAYNLKRLINILSPQDIKEYMKALVLSFFGKISALKRKNIDLEPFKIYKEKIIFQIFFSKTCLELKKNGYF